MPAACSRASAMTPAFADSGALGGPAGHATPQHEARAAAQEGQGPGHARRAQHPGHRHPGAHRVTDQRTTRCRPALDAPNAVDRHLGGRQPAGPGRRDPDPGVARRRSAGRGLAHPVRREGRLARRRPCRRMRRYEARYSAPELATLLNQAYPGNAARADGGPDGHRPAAGPGAARPQPDHDHRASRTCSGSTSPCRRPPSRTGWA